MFGKTKKRIAALEAENEALKAENEKLKALNEELSKKTISQRTMGEGEKPSTSQIIDEWLNGAEEESNG